MKQQIARTLFASRKVLDKKNRAQSTSLIFELFGFDFMVDEDLNAWLIECNTNPSLDESCPYLKRLLARMMEDMLKLTVDQEYGYFYEQVVEVNKQLKKQTEEAGEMLPPGMDLANDESLKRARNIERPTVEGISDQESIWEKLLNFKERSQRKKYKSELL